MRLQAMRLPDPLHRAQGDADLRATARPAQCVASPGGSAHGSASTFATVSADSGALPGLRVLPRNNPSTPSANARRLRKK